MTVFISGAVTGHDDYLERFAEAEQALLAKGYDVVNPAKVLTTLPHLHTNWQACMDITLFLLETCDAIYMLPNWINSKGARVEYTKAHALGLMFITPDKIYEFKPTEEIK